MSFSHSSHQAHGAIPLHDDIREIFLMFTLAACATFTKVVVGFGQGITFQIGYWWMASFGLLFEPRLFQSVLLTYIGFVPVCWINIRWVLQFTEKKFALPFWAAQVTGSVIGSVLLVHYENIWMIRSLGIVFAIMLTLNIFRTCTSNEESSTELDADDMLVMSIAPIFFSVVFISGLLSGIFAVGGAPIMILGLFYNVKKELLSTSTIISVAFGNGLVSVIWLGIVRHGIRSNTWPLCVAVFGGCVLGFGLGRLMEDRCDPKNFRHMMRLLLFCGCALMVSFGLGSFANDIARTAGIVLALGMVGFTAHSVLSREEKCYVELLDPEEEEGFATNGETDLEQEECLSD